MERTIYVYSGIYYEHVIVTKNDLTIVGENKSNTIIDGSGIGAVIKVWWNRVAISGFTVRNSGWGWFYYSGSGIFLDYAVSSCIISDNIVTNTRFGISSWFGSNNTVSGNTISDTILGVSFDHGIYNTMVDNSITGADIGIDDYWGSNNTINGNTISDADEGVHLEHPDYDQVIGNRISNSRVGIYFNYPYHSIVAGNIIEDMTACMPHTCGVYGIHFQEGGSNNTIIDNTVIGYTDYGIAIRYTDENYIAGNTLIGNFYGIELGHSSNDNIVTGNNVTGNGVGISVFENSNNNLITMNKFSGSVPVGFYISDIGIWVESSHDNTVHYNNIVNNGYGFYIYSTSNNKIYHNSIIDNTIQVYSFNSVNMWNNSYPSGGNYWSDYTDIDLYSGPNQDLVGDDGIWDHPYIMDADNQDRYPLAKPWTLDPTEKMQQLIETTEAWNLTKGTENSLSSKLKGAIHLLNKGNENGAIHKLMDFINQVEALRDKKLTTQQADQLTSEAQRIIDLIEEKVKKTCNYMLFFHSITKC